MTEKTCRHKKMADLEANDCRWPIGDPRHEDFHFCGAKQAAGHPYCTEHWNQAFVPGKARQLPGRAAFNLAIPRAA
jgi:GcrA cell cycle regulator